MDTSRLLEQVANDLAELILTIDVDVEHPDGDRELDPLRETRD